MKRFIGIITALILSVFCITAVNAEEYSDNPTKLNLLQQVYEYGAKLLS